MAKSGQGRTVHFGLGLRKNLVAFGWTCRRLCKAADLLLTKTLLDKRTDRSSCYATMGYS
jgi:hypothetical protein